MIYLWSCQNRQCIQEKALSAINFINEKRCGKIKGKRVADGSQQREYQSQTGDFTAYPIPNVIISLCLLLSVSVRALQQLNTLEESQQLCTSKHYIRTIPYVKRSGTGVSHSANLIIIETLPESSNIARYVRSSIRLIAHRDRNL